MCFHICSVSHLLHLHTHLLFLILILLIVLLLCFLAMNSLLGFACPCMLSGLILSGLAGYSLFQLWNWTRHQGLGCLRKTCPESYLLFLHRKPFIRFMELHTMILWYALIFNKLNINYHQVPINFLSSPTLLLLFWPSLSPASFFSLKFQLIREFLSIIISTETIGYFKQASETNLTALSLKAPLQNI